MGALAESILADREILYFFRQDGCGACEAATPELAKYMTKHPTMQVLTLDAAGPYPAAIGVKVKATPTYAYRHGAALVVVEGAMRVGELEKWIKRINTEINR